MVKSTDTRPYQGEKKSRITLMLRSDEFLYYQYAFFKYLFIYLGCTTEYAGS